MSPNKRFAAVASLAAVIAIPAEGLRHYAYYDPPGILTVCYGSTHNVEKGKRYSLEECKARLEKDMLDAVLTVERCHPGLPEPVAASFADAVYNSGPTIACNSTASKFLSAGNFEAACKQHPRWNKAKVAGVYVALPGLTKRTLAREALCLRGVA